MNRFLPWFGAVAIVIQTLVSSATGLAQETGDNKKGGGNETPLPKVLSDARKVLFLGDSITASGQYVAWFDAWLNARHPERTLRLINCGLPSETVSGLSEDGHAGGQFPRPDLSERLDRVLKETTPDLVFACYGINCGIYLPFDEGRFQKYQQGMKRLKEAVEKSGASLVVITPPYFDDARFPDKGFLYNDVLDRYSEWLLRQNENGWSVIDLHGAMTKAVLEHRKVDPKFTMQPDGVHPNEAGHWFIARQLIKWAGCEADARAESAREMIKAIGASPELLPLTQERMGVLRDAYVAAAGHKRPGVATGLSLPEAKAKADELTIKIAALVKQSKSP